MSRRVPVLLQLNGIECGAACLAMVLGYHGRRTTIAQARAVCHSGRGGTSAGTIARAARSFGLSAYGVRPTDGTFDRIALPAIAHWNDDHFVVVEKCGPTWVSVVDPAWGRRRLTRAEFEGSVSDAALVLEPGPEFSTESTASPSAFRHLGGALLRLRGIRPVLLQVFLASILVQVAGLVLPLSTKVIVDQLVYFDHVGEFTLIVSGIVLALIAQLVSEYLRSVLLLYLQGRLDWQVLQNFAGHLFRLPMRYFQERTTGDIVTRLAGVSVLRDMVANQTVVASLDAFLVLGYLAVLFTFEAKLAAILVVIMIAQAAIAWASTGRARELTARSVTAQAGVNEYLVQALSGISTVKALGAEDEVLEGLSRRIFEYTSSSVRRGHLVACFETLAEAFRTVAPLIVLVLGARQVSQGDLSVGTLLAITWVSVAIMAPLTTVVASYQRLQMVGVQMERLGDVLNAEPERPGVEPAPSAPAGALVEIENVSFRYDHEGPDVLHGVSAVIHPGQRVAIVGHTGAGKTTLAWLLMGMYEPTGGVIRYDGVSLTDLSLRDLRRRLGVVIQEPFTLRATVRENIAFASPSASDEDILWAARVAEVDREVRQLPNGYDTRLAERGIGLSGGQLQRLALARALVARPSALVLDEATSHLDAATESRIVANLRDVACTQIVIAHRLSTVRDADLIMVMQEGRLIEVGSHEELLALNGGYAALVAAQIGPPGNAPQLYSEMS